MYICMCDWVISPYSRKLTEHCKPAIMKKIKIIKIKIKFHWEVKLMIRKKNAKKKKKFPRQAAMKNWLRNGGLMLPPINKTGSLSHAHLS